MNSAKLSQKLHLRVIDGTLEYNVLLQPDIFLIFQEFEYNPKFVVLISGFKSLSKSHLELFDRLDGRLIDIPSLHIIGETDQIIGKAKSEHLMQYFSEPMVVYHSGGHYVPSNSANRQKFNEFFDRFIEK